MPKKPINFRLGPIDLRRLQQLAKKREISQAQVIREALKLMAEKEGVK